MTVTNLSVEKQALEAGYSPTAAADAQSSRTRRVPLGWSDWVLLALLATAGVYGVQAGGFHLYVLTLAVTYALVALGNNVLLGHAGLVSIGQGALCAVSAYVFAMLSQSGVGFVPSFVAGVVSAGATGFLIGLPSLRLSGHYFALITFSFALAAGEIIVYFDHYTKGLTGMSVTKNALSPTTNFVVALLFLAAACVGQTLLLSSRVGKALRLIRDSERAAAAAGIWRSKYKLAAFTYSGVLAGIAGPFFVCAAGFISPTMFDMWLSVYMLAAVVIGGMNKPLGAVLGATLVAIVPQFASSYQGLSSIVFGVAILGAVLWRSFANNIVLSRALARSHNRG